LERFGEASGLFGDITVDPMRGNDGSPFQIKVKEYDVFGSGSERAYRNLTDVGYGVSQALPILIELFRIDAPDTFLLQQPEVHLHPSAQAALGSLFCDIAAEGHQLVVETHSDYLIDRIRMDVRDKKTKLAPEGVSILYFEPGQSDVNIHSVTIDRLGNVLGTPPSYGDFFMRETNRSIGILTD
jgi:predicted ATPase